MLTVELRPATEEADRDMICRANRDRAVRGFFAADEGTRVMVAGHAGEAIGVVAIRSRGAATIIRALWVAPERRRGLGTAIVARVIAAESAVGRRVEAFVADSNRPAQRMVSRCGMVPHRRGPKGWWYRTMPTHRIARGDVMLPESLERLMADRVASLAYTDPPWGPGNLKYWRTANGEAIAPDWPLFLRLLAFQLATYCDGPIFVEMGTRWVSDLEAAMARVGRPIAAMATATYGRPARPHAICLFGGDPAWLDGLPSECWAATREIARRAARPGEILLDPCLGLGKSAGVFADAGMAVYGMELNPGRLMRAARRLGVEPCP